MEGWVAALIMMVIRFMPTITTDKLVIAAAKILLSAIVSHYHQQEYILAS